MQIQLQIEASGPNLVCGIGKRLSRKRAVIKEARIDVESQASTLQQSANVSEMAHLLVAR